MNKFIAPAIGVIAFVIGGIVAREQALVAVETLDRKFNSPPIPEEQ